MQLLKKMTWHIIVIAGLTTTFTPALAEAVAPEAKPALEIPSPRHNAGSHWEGEVVSHTFEVRNDGDAELKILSVKPG